MGIGPARASAFSSRAVFVVLAVAALLRFLSLGLKPPHFDEGINGHFVLQIWRDGFYAYDPTNFHGPLYFYLLHVAEIVFGRSVESFRLMNAAIAVGIVGAVVSMRYRLGRIAVWAAWMIALSPAFVFYGRYAIHETLFVLGQVLFAIGRLNRDTAVPRAKGDVMTAIGLVVMATTKETFFIFIGTWLIAEWIEARFFRAGCPVDESPQETLQNTARPISAMRRWAVAAFVVLSILALYTGFMAKPSGVADFFRAFNFWSKTGHSGNGHEKHWIYWVELMVRYEWFMLAALLATPVAFLRSQRRDVRLLALVGFGHWLAYTLIPYKTPWLILGFWPLFFSAGWLIEATKQMGSKWKAVARLSPLVLLLVSGWKAFELSFRKYTDPTEPYVYVQTTPDYTRVMQVLRTATEAKPQIRNELILLLVKDPWPLPYDLSLFTNIRYVRLEELESDPSLLNRAGLLLIDEEPWAGVKKILKKPMHRMSFHLRDAYQGGWALFDDDKFKAFVPLGSEMEGAE